MSRAGDHKQSWSGLFFLLLGAGTLWRLPSNIGTAANMGAGYFPMLLGICLILLGGASMFLGSRSTAGVRAERLPVRTMVLVLSGIFVFAAVIDAAGLAVSLFFLLLLSCADRLRRNFLEVMVTYLVLLGMTWFIFLHVIQLPMKMFWWN